MPLLVALLRSNQPAVQEAVTNALTNLAVDFHHNQKAIIAAGALPLFAALSENKQLRVQAAAADDFVRFALGSQKVRDDTHAAGAVPPMTALLHSHQPAYSPQTRLLLCCTCEQLHDRPTKTADSCVVQATHISGSLCRLLL